MNTNAINWFEIFVTDFEKAQGFYEAILNRPLIPATMENCQMSLFSSADAAGVGGAIAKMEGCNPGPGGTLVYLNVEGDLDAVLQRIPEAGGQVIRGRTPIPPHGFIAIFRDIEGNVVGLHSMV